MKTNEFSGNIAQKKNGTDDKKMNEFRDFPKNKRFKKHGI